VKHCIETYIKLAKQAAEDKNLIPNHCDCDVPNELQGFIDELEELVPLFLDVDGEIPAHVLNNLKTAKEVIKVYESN